MIIRKMRKFTKDIKILPSDIHKQYNIFAYLTMTSIRINRIITAISCYFYGYRFVY